MTTDRQACRAVSYTKPVRGAIRRITAYPVLLVIDACLWMLGNPWRQLRRASQGRCAHCGRPVRHGHPWWTGNPARGGKPLHDECIHAYGLFDD